MKTETIPSSLAIVIGPPGTGKTVHVARCAMEAASRYGPSSVLIASLTKAAAAELIGREIPIPKDRIGTLHAHAYRALGHPQLVSAKHIQDWNERALQWQLPIAERDLDGEDEGPGDRVRGSVASHLAQAQSLYRALMIPPDQWPDQEAAAFSVAWKAWKEDLGLLDFDDLIEFASRDVAVAPGNPQAIYLDECQDSSPAEINLAMRWGASASGLVMVGDPDQSIYQWRGADPDYLLGLVPQSRRRVLGQSYRVPRAVHEWAVNWIEQMPGRQKVEYFPRRENDDSGPFVEGSVIESPHLAANQPDALIEDLRQYLGDGKTVMILCSCGYMLDPLKKALKRTGIPFHNPYRKRRRDWNPLDSAGRMLDYLAPDPFTWGPHARVWTWKKLWSWIEIVDAKHLVRGAKTEVKRMADSEQTGNMQIGTDLEEALFSVGAIFNDSENHSWNGDHRRLRQIALESKKAGLEYIEAVADEEGTAALKQRPKLIIGTIHCSPPDEKILTINRGYVAIEDLVEGVDSLVTWVHECNQISFGSNWKGPGFSKSQRQHDGDIISVITAKSKARVTPDHYVRARFDQAAKGRFVVYLMRSGPCWRVSTTRVLKTSTNTKVLQELLSKGRIDAAWILRICRTREEALAEESTISEKYGVPKLSFSLTPVAQRKRFIFTDLRDRQVDDVVALGAKALMQDFGLELDHPLWSKGVYSNSGYGFETAAANLLPGLMQVAIIEDHERVQRSPKWVSFSIERARYKGIVYGLDVPPYSHYFSGGMLVHNSVKGGEADVVYACPDLSRIAAAHRWTDEGNAAMLRLFYVAFTRARETLVICGSGGCAGAW